MVAAWVRTVTGRRISEVRANVCYLAKVIRGGALIRPNSRSSLARFLNPIGLLCCTFLTGCIPSRQPRTPAASDRPASIDAALSRAEACARAYGLAELGSLGTASEKAEAAVAACTAEERNYAEVYAKRHSVRKSFLLGRPSNYDAVYMAALDAAKGTVHSETLRTVIEASRPPDSNSPRSPPAKQL
jgi:hypothetical protein